MAGWFRPIVLTEAIETVAGLNRYQIIQESLNHFVVRVDGRPADRAAAETQIAGRLRSVIPEAKDVSYYGMRCSTRPPAENSEWSSAGCHCTG